MGTLHNNVFAWAVAGDDGRVDIAWYGTPGVAPDRFRRQGEMMSHINHPNVVQIYDHDERGGDAPLQCEARTAAIHGLGL